MREQQDLEKVTSKYNFDETVDILKNAIKTAGFFLIHEINTQQILEKHGIIVHGLKQLLYFSPIYMKQLLDVRPESAIQAPLKFLVREEQDGVVRVLYIKPSDLFSHDIELREFGKNLDGITGQISVSIIS
jgi:uncharacterized protein (DUF302 family)